MKTAAKTSVNSVILTFYISLKAYERKLLSFTVE